MNKLIEMFVRSNATLALQQNLILNSTLITKILEACSPAEMVMLNANLPQFKQLLLSSCEYQVYDKELYFSMDDCIISETFDRLRTVTTLNVEFVNFYETTLSDLIRESLKSLIVALITLKNELGIAPANAFSIISHLDGEAEQQNVITYATAFTDVAKREVISAIIEHDSVEVRTPTDRYMPLIITLFQHFSPHTQYQLITPALIAKLTFANALMQQLLGVDKIERNLLLRKIYITAIDSLEEVIFHSLDNVFYSLQTDAPRNQAKLKSLLVSQFLNKLQMQFPTVAEAWNFGTMLFNDNTLKVILSLPLVNAINGTRHLDAKIIRENQDSLRSAFIMLKSEGRLAHNVNLQSLPAPQPTEPATNYLYHPYAWGAGACLLFVTIAACKAYSFFQKPKTGVPSLKRMLSGSNDHEVETGVPRGFKYKSS